MDKHETQQTARLGEAETRRISAFVQRNFSLHGTLELHRVALGWDLLRAPANVALGIIFILVQLVARVAGVLRLRRLSGWLTGRKIYFKTAVARELERRLETELLQGRHLNDSGRALIANYTAVRSAVAEITTMLFMLCIGLIIFGTATPGMASLAPKVSEYVAHSSEVAHFPLGRRLGELWYWTFPQSRPLWFVLTVGVGLALLASVFTTFSGLIADPVQARLGIHRRRLFRLLQQVSATEDGAPPLAPEHILARVGDLADALVSLLRVLRP